MTTVKKTSAMAGKEVKQGVFSEEITDPIHLGISPEKNAGTPSKERVTAPSVEDIEAKIAYMASKPGLRSKIDANCMYCSYDPLDVGTWRQQVEQCGVSNCPLFSVRPTSRGKK